MSPVGLVGWLILPALTVGFYGVLIVYHQRRYHQGFSATIKGSPYVLGFLLTLVSLLSLFLKARGELVSGQAQPDLLIGQLGAALATSVVGLLFRHVIFAFDPGETDQQETFDRLAKQLRMHSHRFEMAQRQLVTLIEEFVETREGMFSREEDSSKKYVDELERLREKAVSLHDSTLTEMTRLTEMFGDLAKETQESFRYLTRSIAQTKSDLAAEATATGDAANTVVEHSRAIGHQADIATGKLVKVSEAALRMATSTEDAMSKLVENLGELDASVKGSVTAIQNLPASVGQVTEGASKQLEADLGAARENLAKLSETLQQETRRLLVSWQTQQEQFDGRARQIGEDLQAVDAIVDEVVTLLKRRIDALSRSEVADGQL